MNSGEEDAYFYYDVNHDSTLLRHKHEWENHVLIIRNVYHMSLQDIIFPIATA